MTMALEAPADLDRPGADLQRLPALDGFRAVAVAIVVVFHAEYAPGGSGIDVFFVLSGFLTALTLVRAQEAKGSLRGVLTRHLARVYPPFLVFLIAAALFSLLAPRPDRPRWLLDVGLAAVNLINFRVAYGGPTNGVLSPVWVLSTLEQYFAVSAILTWALLRSEVRLTRIAAGALVAAVLAGVARSWASTSGIGLAHLSFSPEMHLDGWLVGIGAGILYASGWLQARPGFLALRDVVVPLGMAIAVFDIFVPARNSWLLGGGNEVYIVVCAGAVIGGALAGDAGTGPFSSRLLTLAGRGALSIYLWHGAMLYGAHQLHLTHRWMVTVVAFAGLAVIATISYVVIERPLQARRRAGWSLADLSSRRTA